MFPEQTTLMLELIKAYDVFGLEMSHAEKAEAWTNISIQCNCIEGVEQKSVEQYKRHWYDLKMKVKNKILRIYEFYTTPSGTEVPEQIELTDEELFVARYVRNMDGMTDIVDRTLGKRFKLTPLRSREQTAMLLKLVWINKEELQKKCIPDRRLIWQNITDTLNAMPGSRKDYRGWKKVFWTWRLQAGDRYEEEMERLAQKHSGLSHKMTKAHVQRNSVISKFDNKMLNGENDDRYAFNDLSAEQEDRFYELLMENKLLLRSGKMDPLRRHIWSKIATELNALPGVTLTAEEWSQRENWDKRITKSHHKSSSLRSSYKGSRKRKHVEDLTIKTEPDDISNDEAINDTDGEWRSEDSIINSCENYIVDESQDLIYEGNDDEHEQDVKQEFMTNDQDMVEVRTRSEQHSKCHSPSSVCEDEFDYKPKRLKYPTPLAASLKFNRRIVKAVELLTDDVTAMNDTLHKTTEALATIELILERQSEKQEETNKLLRQNNELLKMLIKYRKKNERIKESNERYQT